MKAPAPTARRTMPPHGGFRDVFVQDFEALSARLGPKAHLIMPMLISSESVGTAVSCDVVSNLASRPAKANIGCVPFFYLKSSCVADSGKNFAACWFCQSASSTLCALLRRLGFDFHHSVLVVSC